jgi:hypothetical protein
MFEYGLDLKVLGYAIFYTHANETAYDSWTFKSPSDYDEFYYDDSTVILVVTWKNIGFQVAKNTAFTTIKIRLILEKKIGLGVGNKILSVPY